ncbi:MAG: hypothetical protein PHS38_12720 [Bacteroidales bacterium]|nr:hypothetical protein [Bacteroidales bacterium]
MAYHRIFIISTNALRRGGSNGKVLNEMLTGWPCENLAQFYTYPEKPDTDICKRFYRVTNKEALTAFIRGNKVGKRITNSIDASDEDLKIVTNKKPSKNPMSLLLRDILWTSRRWASKEFWSWIEEYKPEIILLQAGESSYLHWLTILLSKKYNIPYLILNTENYYLKRYNYLKGYGWGILYPLYKWECDTVFRKLMKGSSGEIYTNTLLDDKYFSSFCYRGNVIFQSSSLQEMPDIKNQTPIFSYAGNLGLDRHLALIELAQALQCISPNYYLDVYGQPPKIEVENALRSASGIRFHGMIPYENVIEVMRNSDYMIHAESFDPFWVKDLDCAFSTKLSDLLSAGKCVILYASPSLACTKYFVANNCGCVIDSPLKLSSKLNELLSSRKLRDEYRKNAIDASHRDMNCNKNAEKFRMIVSKTLNA